MPIDEESKVDYTPLFKDGEVEIVVRDYICAQCYGDLMKYPHGRLWNVVCRTCHKDVGLVGRITRSWAERQGQTLAARRRELEDRYLPKPARRDSDDVLKELGF